MTKMAAVARELRDALDSLPLHTKQLAEMFRKHGTKHGRDGDELMQLDIDLAKKVDGWKPDGPTPHEIVDAGKGHRPDPDDYLDDDYIRHHLERFADGGTRFYRADSLARHGQGNGGTTFVFPTAEVDDLIAQADGDPRRLGQLLGLGEDFFVDGDGNAVDVIRADFSPDHLADGNLRLPSGNEGGANPQWIPGGYLPAGIPEAVISIPDGGGTDNLSDFHVG